MEPPPRAGVAAGDEARLDLRFGLSPSGRTGLVRHFVRYPWHLTRPFHLDREPRGLATLFVQSVSGGLYDGEEVGGRIHVAPGAQAHVTTTAATIVHRGSGIRHRMTLEVAEDGFLAYTPEAAILFDGAGLAQRTLVGLRPGAHVVLSDAVIAHDPRGRGGGLRYWRSEIEFRDAAGRARVDRQHLPGGELAAALGPRARFRGMISVFLLGPCYGEESAGRLRELLSRQAGAYVGVSRLPEGGGVMVRALAESGSILSALQEACFAAGFAARFGAAPAPRRK